jgi:hypothetical protein
MLTDMMVRQAKATDKPYTLADFNGLSLFVSDNGTRVWHLRYTWAGQRVRISLGSYPELSLHDARCLRDEAWALLAKGGDPRTDRKQKRHAIQLAAEHSFKAVFDVWVEHRRKELKEGRQSTLSQIDLIFAKDVLPTLGKMSIYDIRRPQLLGVLAKIEARKAFTTAEKVRTWFRQMFRYALVIVEGLEMNPATDLWLCDAVSAIRNIAVENRVVNPLGVKLKFRPARTINSFKRICRRRDSAQNFRFVFQQAALRHFPWNLTSHHPHNTPGTGYA